MTKNMIECSQVRKKYPSGWALDGLDLSVPPGSVFGLLGKNGAGKTTLLKCLLGMLYTDSGSLSILGMKPENLDGATKARIGYVPQKVSLYPWMKVQGITEYVGSFYTHWNDERVKELLHEWELKPEDKVGTLSVGQAQKLAIILALGHEPELLILDEPAASLDPAARRQFLKTLLDLSQERRQTVVFSTHITADIERIADSVGIIKAGKTIFSGELGALKDMVKKIHLTSSIPLPAQLECGGTVLSQEVRGTEAMLTVQGFTDALAARLQSLYSADVQVRDLNLEDIFLALHNRGAHS